MKKLMSENSVDVGTKTARGTIVQPVMRDTVPLGRRPASSESDGRQVRERHHITPPQEDDFRLITPTVIGDLARGTSRTLSFLLGALAGLSLLVGGVVLMNILLISVAERTKEIGLRRAVGATQRDVFLQFLTESLAVTFLGMLLGTGLGHLRCAVQGEEPVRHSGPHRPDHPYREERRAL